MHAAKCGSPCDQSGMVQPIKKFGTFWTRRNSAQMTRCGNHISNMLWGICPLLVKLKAVTLICFYKCHTSLVTVFEFLNGPITGNIWCGAWTLVASVCKRGCVLSMLSCRTISFCRCCLRSDKYCRKVSAHPLHCAVKTRYIHCSGNFRSHIAEMVCLQTLLIIILLKTDTKSAFETLCFK